MSPQIARVSTTRVLLEYASSTLPTAKNVLLLLTQEMIQNADDAKATEVKFILDHRQLSTLSPSLVGPHAQGLLGRFQGPALLAYNDAAFSEKDWEGIQNLQQSGKAKDPFKVGKFGIGFNSVYHITGESEWEHYITNMKIQIFIP